MVHAVYKEMLFEQYVCNMLLLKFEALGLVVSGFYLAFARSWRLTKAVKENPFTHSLGSQALYR